MHAILGRVSGGEDLTMQEMSDVVDSIMQGRWPDAEIALLLTALSAKGESVAEIAGAAQALRKHMTRIATSRTNVVDTCGTGGDGSGTFNISTAAALVTAAAGVPVAKHGNRAMSSKSGSADVLAALGVNVEAPVTVAERCLEELGICFCFAPLLHPAMKHVSHVRRQLGVPTLFNLLGPLANPASARFQLLGVGKADVRGRLAAALALLGTERAVVVRGRDGLDEVTLTGSTDVTVVSPQGLRELVWNPSDFGSSDASLDSARVSGPEASAQQIREVLAGQPGPAREVVILNAAAAIWTAGADNSLTGCADRAADAIDQGEAARLLDRLARLTHIGRA